MITPMEESILIKEIESAFSDVHLEEGISLNMAEYYDTGGNCKKKSKNDERYHWKKIEDKTLEQFTVTFSFTDLKGFRFYLPVYMIYALRNYKTSDSMIIDHIIYAIDVTHFLFNKISMKNYFEEKQLACMISFLEFCSTRDDFFDAEIAKINLRTLKYHMNEEM